MAVITQVFPDEFHLNTLDQLLSAIGRLNPHVNIKSIVIGLMDRLSSYAARESESEPREARKQTEDEAAADLIEKLRIAKETNSKGKQAEDEAKHENTEQTNGNKVEETIENDADQSLPKDSEPASQIVDGKDKNLPPKKNRGIPDNVKLFEIFYEQVINLVNTQRLQIQDTIALLVSLANLAL